MTIFLFICLLFLIGHTNNLCIHSSHHFVCLPNSGVCGITQDGSTNYDDWLDSNGQPMPWTSQGVYQQGQIIDIEQTITAHHNGHIEMWACPLGRLCMMNDFKNNKLEFVDDVGRFLIYSLLLLLSLIATDLMIISIVISSVVSTFILVLANVFVSLLFLGDY